MEHNRADGGSEPVRTGSGCPRLVLIIGLLLACYPLSIGPAWKLQESRVISWEAYARIYCPLHAISRKSPVLMNIVDWYVIKLWHGHYRFIYY